MTAGGWHWAMTAGDRRWHLYRDDRTTLCGADRTHRRWTLGSATAADCPTCLRRQAQDMTVG